MPATPTMPDIALPLLPLANVLSAKEGPGADLLNRVAMPSEYSARVALFNPFHIPIPGVGADDQLASICSADQWDLLRHVGGRLKLLVAALSSAQELSALRCEPSVAETSQEIPLPSITGLAPEQQELLLVFVLIPALRSDVPAGFMLGAAFLNETVLFAWDVS